MSGFIQGEDRFQATLFPERLEQIYLSLNQPVFASPHKKTPTPARKKPSPIGDAQLNVMNESILIYLLWKME